MGTGGPAACCDPLANSLPRTSTFQGYLATSYPPAVSLMSEHQHTVVRLDASVLLSAARPTIGYLAMESNCGRYALFDLTALDERSVSFLSLCSAPFLIVTIKTVAL